MVVIRENTAATGQTEPDRHSTTASPRKILAVIGVLCGLVNAAGLSGCVNSAPGKSAAPAASTPVPTQVPQPETWPLTGLERPANARARARQAVAVKIENTSAARPQSGLEAADIVFEELVEGGVTRYNAIFHSQQPEEIGPVRSVRPMDPAIAAPFRAWLVYSGGVPQFEQRVRDEGLRGFNEDQAMGASYRVQWRWMPHNLYLSIPALLGKFGGAGATGAGGADSASNTAGDAANGATDTTEPEKIFEFTKSGETPSAVSTGVEVKQLVVNFPAAHARFDWNGSKWQRVDEGVASTARSGVPLQADNVVVVRTTTVATNALDSAGFPVPETVMEGGGQAYVATGGKIMDAKWSKDSVGSPLVLTDVSGAPIVLAPGQTWVELLAAGTFSYS